MKQKQLFCNRKVFDHSIDLILEALGDELMSDCIGA